MKLYSRVITVRGVDRSGHTRYIPYREYVYTDDITPYNRRKRVPFREDLTHSGEAFIPDKVVRVMIKQ